MFAFSRQAVAAHVEFAFRTCHPEFRKILAKTVYYGHSGKQLMLGENVKKPYYAVIFTSTRNDEDEGYAEMAEEMEQLARQQEGFISMDTAQGPTNITVCYWSSLEAISAWKQQVRHRQAQKLGKSKWYRDYSVKVCKVERDYSFEIDNAGHTP